MGTQSSSFATDLPFLLVKIYVDIFFFLVMYICRRHSFTPNSENMPVFFYTPHIDKLLTNIIILLSIKTFELFIIEKMLYTKSYFIMFY